MAELSLPPAAAPNADSGERWRVAGQVGDHLVVRQTLPIPDELLLAENVLYQVHPDGLRRITTLPPLFLLRVAGAGNYIV